MASSLAATNARTGPRKGAGLLARRQLSPWLLLLPAFVSLGSVSVYPILNGL